MAGFSGILKLRFLLIFSLLPLFIKGFPQSALIATGTAVGNRCLLIKQAYRAKAAVLQPIQSAERTGKKFKEKKKEGEKKKERLTKRRRSRAAPSSAAASTIIWFDC